MLCFEKFYFLIALAKDGVASFLVRCGFHCLCVLGVQCD